MNTSDRTVLLSSTQYNGKTSVFLSQKSLASTKMQPYRNVPANQFFPIYWNCQQCSCENCAVAREQGTSACPTPSETQRPSFTIESLLSRKGERKPDLNQIGASSLKVTLVPGGSSGQLSNENVSTELIGSDHASRSYLPQFHRPPSQFGLEHASLFGRANIQANGELSILCWRSECLQLFLLSNFPHHRLAIELG